MTRVVLVPSDESACGFYRMRLPAGAVRTVRPDWEIEVYRPSDVKLGTGYDGRLWQVGGIRDPKSVDLFVMQRIATRAQAELLGWMQRQGAATVMDSDDAMWCIDPENTAWKAWNTDTHNWRWMETAAQHVDLTTVTTPALERRYGRHGRAEVLPNCVPGDLPDLLESARDAVSPETSVGWSGFTATHPGDLKVVEGAVRDAQRDTGCVVRVVGDAAGAARDWGCEVDPVAPTGMGLPYFTALTTIDVGLVPLRDTPFNRAKSYLKALEFAAVGAAVVASPTPANRELANTVPMILASTPEEWHWAITELVTNPGWRAEMGRIAQERVMALRTYEARAEHWARAWERAMARRARLTA